MMRKSHNESPAFWEYMFIKKGTYQNFKEWGSNDEQF